MRYGKLLIYLLMMGGLTACSLIPPADEQPPNMSTPDIQPLKSDGEASLYPPNAEDSSPDDSAPVVVPPALSKNGSGS